MSRKPRRIILLLSVFACLVGRGVAATALGSVTIGGGEQSSGSTYDTGTVTATINGISVSLTYGQFTTPAGIASALGALITNNCNMPIYAQANGTTLTFYQKGGNTMTSASITSVSNNPSLFPSNSFQVGGGGAWLLAQISLSLPEGPPQMGVTITGGDFGAAAGRVTIGGIPVTILSWSPNSITVQVPNGLAVGLYDVGVTTATWAINGGAKFQVDNPFACN
ncbi:IPT/TIG domain-containing protein [Terriglobus albidus]|uniref:IPT/TIG domain-containing protein n=1 Tax=Terriglobus albidus TaxID=1592106 RepID=UPI0021DFC3FD|nr:IPT/TIG domain-containing protein [Terriglobus albidus]